MSNKASVLATLAIPCAGLLGLGASTAAVADLNDLATTASTAGTTAYIVGREVEGDDYARAREFATSRSVALRRDAAMGEGENVEALAALLGEDPQALGRWMQANYSDLYQGLDNDAALVNRIVAMR